MRHRDLDSYVFVSLSRELFWFSLCTVLSLLFVGSPDLVRQWPAVHNRNKQRFINETFKTAPTNYLPDLICLDSCQNCITAARHALMLRGKEHF